jgi:cytochrome P450
MLPSFDIVEPSIRDVDFGALTTTDALEQIDRLRANGHPVVPVRFHDSVAWMVLGYDAVTAVLMNEEQLPAADFYQRTAGPWWGRTVPTMRGDEHRAHRAFFLVPLLPTRMRACAETVLVPLANDLITKFDGRREVDFVADYARRYPFRVITRLLDLPDEDNSLIHKLVSELFQFVWDPEAASRARTAMTDYLRPYALARRTQPGADIISYFASTEVNGRLLDETDLLDFIRFLYPAAGENTTNALGLMMYRILADRAIYERVLNNPRDRHAAVEEVLRIDPAVPVIVRYSEKAVTIADTVIPAHSSILLAISSANRDPRHCANPEVFSFERAANDHVAFGRGPHFCAGAHLARAELRTTLDLMLDRLPELRLVDPGKLKFNGAMMRGPAALPIAFADVLPETKR